MGRVMKESGIEWIGQIPEDWHIVKMKYISDFYNGYAFDSGDLLADGDFPVIRIGDISNGTVDFQSACKTCKERGLDDYQIKKGDLLIAMSGATVGKTGFVSITNTKAYINQRVGIIRGLYNHYLKYCLMTPQFFDYIQLLSSGTAQPNISTVGIRDYPVCISSFEDIRVITNFLDSKCALIDAIIEKTKASIEEYKKLKQAIITQAVTKGIRPNRKMKDSGIEWIGEIPEEWSVIRNAFLFKENVRVPDEDAIPLSLSQVDGLISTDDMKESSLKTSTYDGWKQVRLNDLVLNRFKGHLGVLYSATIEGMVSFHYGVYEPIKDFNSKFFEYLYHSELYKGELGLKSNGMTVGLQNLSNQNFYSVQSLYPPVEEQTEIIDYLDSKIKEIKHLCEMNEQYITELENYKKSLIYEYVTGKKEVV